METVNHECYVSLEVAKLLKEAGFDWECKMIHFCYVEDDYMWNLEDNDKKAKSILKLDYCLLAPTLDVAQRWLRELKGIFICTTPEIKDYYATWNFYICNEQGLFYENEDCFLTYEEAQEAGIKKALEMILEKGE